MEIKTTDLILGILTILSLALAVISPEYRTIAIASAFILMIMGLISLQNFKMRDLIFEQKRLKEKLKIHEQLINIKKDIELLKEKNGKK